jgi:allophanate hydrolase
VGPAWADERVAALAHDLGSPATDISVHSPGAVPSGTVPLVVAGAHLRGEALEHQVLGCGGRWQATTRTAARYALHLVAEDPPRPGLVRTDGPGAAIEVDVWALPPEGWARFVAAGVPGLAVGRVELADGSVLPGFVAAAGEATGHPDLSPYGGWRAWRAAGSPR